jgi:hypothetical protein
MVGIGIAAAVVVGEEIEEKEAGAVAEEEEEEEEEEEDMGHVEAEALLLPLGKITTDAMVLARLSEEALLVAGNSRDRVVFPLP